MPDTITKTLPESISSPSGFFTVTESGLVTNSELLSYFTKLKDAGFTLNPTELAAFDTFISSLKSANGQNVWNSIMELYPIYGSAVAHGMVKLKGALSSENMAALLAGGTVFSGFDNGEIVSTKLVGFLGLGGTVGGSPNAVAGQIIDTGIEHDEIYAKTSDFSNQNSYDFGFTFVGDSGYSVEGAYPDEADAFFEDVFGYREFDSPDTSEARATLDRDDGSLGAYPYANTIHEPGSFSSGDRFQRIGADGSTSYAGSGVLGGTFTQDSQARTVVSFPRDATKFVLMGSARYNNGSAVEGSPGYYGAYRQHRCRMFMIDDGSINTAATWEAVSAAVDTLFTALGKNTW